MINLQTVCNRLRLIVFSAYPVSYTHLVTLIFQLGNGDGKNGGKHRAADIQEGNTQGIPHHIQEILGIGDNFLKVLQSCLLYTSRCV